MLPRILITWFKQSLYYYLDDKYYKPIIVCVNISKVLNCTDINNTTPVPLGKMQFTEAMMNYLDNGNF